MSGASRAAWVLAAGLWVWPLLPASPPAIDCSRPAALDAGAAHSRQVGCQGGAPLGGPARLLFGLRLDLNRADAASLQSLPGIGPVRAAAIVSERKRRPFDSLDALIRVRGIGPHTLEGVRAWLEVAPAGAPRSRRSG